MRRGTHFLAPFFEARKRCGLKVSRTGVWLADELEAALDSSSRKKGLLGRDALPPACGLVIAPSQGVHTFGMRFPIDIVAVGRDGRVVKWRSDVPARRIVMAWSAFAIVELAAGTVERVGLQRGDQLVVVDSPS